MAQPRFHDTATLLPSGDVLVTGGDDANGLPMASAELYDPSTHSWHSAAPMVNPRDRQSAILLADGRVLVVGSDSQDIGATAETYSEATNTWTALPNMPAVPSSPTGARYDLALVRLADGRVMVVGGAGDFGELASVLIFDPSSNSWMRVADLHHQRSGAAAVLLPNGDVLVQGGWDGNNYLTSAEVYDPATNTWSAAGATVTPHYFSPLLLLPNELVLSAGGTGDQFLGWVSTAELYDPSTNSWSLAAPMPERRFEYAATQLTDGDVLIEGGYDNSGLPSTSATLYDPATNTWTAASSMLEPRDTETAVLLADGTVLVSGGLQEGGAGILNTAEIYGPPFDATTPVITVPSTVYARAASRSGTVVTYTVSATDPDDAASTPVCSPASGSLFAIGFTTVNCASTDTHGNTGTATFIVNVGALGADCVLGDYSTLKGSTARNLKGANLSDCYLAGANLQDASARGANLAFSNLAGANLTSADLAQANLQHANLAGAELTKANLSGANLTGATTNGADFTSVTFSQTTCPDGTVSNADGGTCIAHL